MKISKLMNKKKFNLTAIIAIIAGINIINHPVQAQMFDNLSISPNFPANQGVLTGISGGNKKASELVNNIDTQTGLCVGFVDEKPSHTLVLKKDFNYLSLLVDSPGDTTLIIKSDQWGTWCNDNYKNRRQNPGVAGDWKAGTYKIWLGSSQEKSSHLYKITISETQE
jgi:hypothetical protein